MSPSTATRRSHAVLASTSSATEIADYGVEGITCSVETGQDVYRMSVSAPGETRRSHAVLASTSSAAVTDWGLAL